MFFSISLFFIHSNIGFWIFSSVSVIMYLVVLWSFLSYLILKFFSQQCVYLLFHDVLIFSFFLFINFCFNYIFFYIYHFFFYLLLHGAIHFLIIAPLSSALFIKSVLWFFIYVLELPFVFYIFCYLLFVSMICFFIYIFSHYSGLRFMYILIQTLYTSSISLSCGGFIQLSNFLIRIFSFIIVFIFIVWIFIYKRIFPSFLFLLSNILRLYLSVRSFATSVFMFYVLVNLSAHPFINVFNFLFIYYFIFVFTSYVLSQLLIFNCLLDGPCFYFYIS